MSGAAALLVILSGCGGGPGQAPSIGEAYVGPAVLKIRGDIPLESPTVATVKHGDRLELLRRRRRFFLVRTPGGAEGWTDERELLNSQEMADLKDLAERTVKMPAQGQGTTYGGELNVHTQPNRRAPSFVQIRNKEKVDVVADIVVPRVDLPEAPLLPPTPKKARTLVRKPPREPKYPPLPMPKPPAPPANWLDLSKTAPDPEAPPPEPEEAPVQKPVPTDHWSLVRMKSGQSGWVLTRRLFMAIPDEVAQYAEGRRIVSYFALAETVDGDQKKPTWLWTTIGGDNQPYDFDSFRVFVWSLRHHRYETAYIMRNVRGYSPVLLREVEFSLGKTAAAAKYPGFSICVEKDDGRRYRQEFALLSNIVRFAGERPCEAAAPVMQVKSGETAAPQGPQENGAQPAQPPPARGESFVQRLKKRVRVLTQRWLGR